MHSDDTDPLTPDERRRAVARVLAAAVLRLRGRAALPAPPAPPAAKILTESGPNCLEVPGETRLSVPPG
jgi:hypothetical protein